MTIYIKDGFNQYQFAAGEFVSYPVDFSVTYPALGLAGEAGEVCDKIKKIIRDKLGVITPEDQQAIAKELGDVLWYVAAVARDLKLDMGDIALLNLKKLTDRAERGVLGGNGDNR